MNYGMYLSASGVMVNAHRQDVLSNNLANVNTAGFKPMFTDVRQRLPESVEDAPVDYGLSNALLDKLGGGVFGNEQHVAFRAAAPIDSGRDLDAALTTDNAFFVVQHNDTATGEPGVRLTRSGKFGTNADGQLITQSGQLVLNNRDKPIQVGGARAVIRESGEIELFNNQGTSLGKDQLQVVKADLSMLKPAGENTFAMTGGDSREAIARPVLMPRHYESSGTNAISTLMQIVSATKAATGNANMIRYHDQMLNASVNTFARVS